MENSQTTGGPRDLGHAYRTAYLIAGFLKDTLSEEEKVELDEWILASDENMILFEKMTDEKNLAKANEWFKKMNVEGDLQKTRARLGSGRAVRFWQYAVAAVVVAAMILGIYFYQNSGNRTNQPSIAGQKQDIMPGFDNATLTLENGQVIELGNKGKDTAINSHAKILRKDGQVVYSSAPPQNQLVYHTLTVPRKGQYKIVLPDGSRVWLNSESSIKFPIAFAGPERRVFVTGEAFFEVAGDKEKPFRVIAADVLIEALGTQFNVNAYNNEPFYATTLVEGSVMVTKGPTENILKPGQQAQISEDSFDIVKADIDEATAWKDAQFKFRNTPLKSIMRQIERWYDAEIVYQDEVNLHLNITIDRNEPVSKLLSIFEETNQVHFKIEGRKIFVMK